MNEIIILRLGHRRDRDKRITTHCALVARAFLAKKMYYSGDRDEKIEEKIRKVVENFGGSFEIEYVEDWKELIKNFEGIKVHLTMYGIPLLKKIEEIKKNKKILVIVGSEKVPREVYDLADYNISITNQPHSEVAALAIFLDKFFESKEFFYKFENAKIEIIPQERGKRVIRYEKVST
jgi:tRNA (cytidine56-2'-O)-methyltransferase